MHVLCVEPMQEQSSFHLQQRIYTHHRWTRSCVMTGSSFIERGIRQSYPHPVNQLDNAECKSIYLIKFDRFWQKIDVKLSLKGDLMTNSRISGFYNMTLDERRAQLEEALSSPSGAQQTPEGLSAWVTGGLSPEAADHMIENVIGLHSLPLGIALNFQVNGRDVLVPMTIEEPSVVAGASFMAKLARAGGGFTATTSEPLMIGQMQVINVVDLYEAKLKIYEHKAELLSEADSIDPILKKFGGGARDLEVRVFEESPIGGFLVIHLIYDVRDAMGANAVNTACERLAPRVETITGGKVHLRILSNLADRRIARARCTIPVKELAFTVGAGTSSAQSDLHDRPYMYTGEDVRDGII